MQKTKQPTESEIELQSLSNEISEKAMIIARLNAQMYKLASDNTKLKKRVKSENKKSNK